jgi:alcohol dehydrogenase
MKALIFEGTLELREVAVPAIAAGEALIRVSMAGVCGTDREILRGYAGFRGILGHEFVGQVVECAIQEWVGQRVVGEINITCGRCAQCQRGLGRHCPNRTVMGIANRPGCFAEYVALPCSNLHAVPDSISDEAAVFTEPVAAAAEILEQLPLPPGQRVAILGDGRLGLLIAQVLMSAGQEVTLIGKHDWKLELARAWGAAVSKNGVADFKPASFPMVVEATGTPRGLEESVRLVEPRGTVVLKSTFHGPANLDVTKVVVDEITLLGSRCGNFSVALDLLCKGRVRVEPLVTKVFPLEAGIEAFEYLEQTPCLKVLLAVHSS